MASDVLLVLGSRQRRLLELAERCRRPARGLADPVADLAREAVGDSAAMAHLIESTRRLVDAAAAHQAIAVRATIDTVARRSPIDVTALLGAVDVLLATQEPLLAGWSQARVDHRRQWGRTYRRVAANAERAMRSAGSRSLPSGTELYERARRAGVAQRSRMTVRQLHAAVEAAERQPEVT